jgi:uncharacterized phage protein (TIGR01671 family)
MKILKFRAWDTDDKIMRNITRMNFVNNKVLFEGYNINYVCDYPIMQYTNKKDAEKIEVYEGDIIEVIGWDKIYYTVEFKDCAFVARKVVHNDFWTSRYHDLHGMLEFKIVGNIYENPELI